MSDFIVITLIPNLLFFVVAFIAFSVVEGLIIFLLLWLERVGRDRLMLLMLRVYKHFRMIRFLFRLLGFILVGGAIWYISYLFKIFESRPEIPLSAVVMFTIMTLLYLLITHFKSRFSIKRRGDRVLYLILSVILYFCMMIFIDQKFPQYRRQVVDIVVVPAIELFEGFEGGVPPQEEEVLLEEFRAMLLEGKCIVKDYRVGASADVVHNFVYIGTDEEFRIAKGEPSAEDLRAITFGHNCTNGQETFILTKYGKWYWVIESEPI